MVVSFGRLLIGCAFSCEYLVFPSLQFALRKIIVYSALLNIRTINFTHVFQRALAAGLCECRPTDTGVQTVDSLPNLRPWHGRFQVGVVAVIVSRL